MKKAQLLSGAILSDTGLGPKTIEEISKAQAPPAGDGKRQLMATMTVANPDEAFLKFCVEVMKQEFFSISLLKGVVATLVLMPLGPVVSRGNEGGDVMGVKGEKLMEVAYTILWDLESVDSKVNEAMNNGLKRMEVEAKKRGIWNRWRYLNYAKWDQDPIASYGEENVALLRGVKARLDPEGVWGRLVKGGFQIPGTN